MAPTQTKTGLLFLTVNPLEKNRRKIELQNSEALSHAAKRGHQNRKQAVSQLRLHSPPRSRKPQPLGNNDDNPASLLYLLQPLPLDDSDEAEARWELTYKLRGQNQSPTNALDATFCDPFDVFGVKNPPKYVFELIEFAIRCVWPRSCPTTADGATHIVKSYMSVIMESPTALHAAVSVQLGRIPLFSTTPENRKMAALERMKHQNQAFDQINREIRELEGMPSRIPSEGILNAVGLLALYGTITANTRLVDDHPLSPLATAQSLNVYGRMELVEEHIKGMHLLVRRKEESMGRSGLGITHREPARSIVDTSLEVQALFDSDGSSLFDAIGENLYNTMGKGFASVDGITNQQVRAVNCAAKLTVALDQHLRDSNMELAWGTIVQGRNSAHHELLKVAPAFQDTDDDTDSPCSKLDHAGMPPRR